jgi:hypothetical protein
MMSFTNSVAARRQVFAFLCLVSSLGGAAAAQTVEPRSRKFDELTEGAGSRALRWSRNYDEQGEEIKRRLALYAAELRRAGARPYAITYGQRVVESEIYNRSVAGMRASALWPHLTGMGFDWRHINTVDGGFREEAATELWVVPPGAQPPCPTPGVGAGEVAYCPFVSVGGASYRPDPGGTVRFKAVVRSNDEKIRPTYAWKVSRGRIAGGEGTDSIEVELPEGATGEVVARVEVGGFSLECPAESTAASARSAVGLTHFLFDSFGNIPSGDTKARLDNLTHALGEDPTLQVHVVAYGGRNGPRGQALRRAMWIRDYLVNTRGVDPSRIVTADGGHRNELSGAGLPPVRPTVDESFVKPLPPGRTGATTRRRDHHAQTPAQPRGACDLPPSRKADEFGPLGLAEERARLDKFVAALKAEPEGVRGFIVAYAGRTARAGDALRRADAAKAHLTDTNTFINSRLNTIDCGRREQAALELWLTPPASAPPACAPTVTPRAASRRATGGGRGKN